jgi:tRNA (guanine-N7-)-methyltransferase
MSRRRLRIPDVQLDLAQHLLTADRLPVPFDSAKLFARRGPLTVEVGSGKGLFLDNVAAALADQLFLGIELSATYARYAAMRLARGGRQNALVVCADARWMFREYFPADTLEAVHIYFPDPWWKKRHQRRRVMTADFLRHVERTLRAGGQLHFWTDVREQFDHTLRLIADHTELMGPFSVAESPPLHNLDYRTHFERRVRLNKLPVFRAEFQKRSWTVELMAIPGWIGCGTEED